MNSPIDWQADPWFAKHHANQLTEEFKVFWLEYYGVPDDYAAIEDEQHEYWVRCAFALVGWRTSQERLAQLETALRKLRDAAAVSQQNADQVGVGPEYAEATRLLAEFKESKP